MKFSVPSASAGCNRGLDLIFLSNGEDSCSPPKECCTLDCCYASFNPPGYRPPAVPPPANLFSIVLWNHWYF
uniref:Uncharacterized protein n=1 Tax=Timema shepardi TaxID=629360 RepID=A0A7R9B3K9_TIMSH|nr:unnamed protein product [Timema shepardi]